MPSENQFKIRIEAFRTLPKLDSAKMFSFLGPILVQVIAIFAKLIQPRFKP